VGGLEEGDRMGRRSDSLDQYARRVLLRAFLDERRRPWRREVPIAPHPAVLDRPAVEAGSPDNRMLLRSALSQVPGVAARFSSCGSGPTAPSSRWPTSFTVPPEQ
jgi:DNA-directed RNA polymerase specialized sigma24 family protein